MNLVRSAGYKTTISIPLILRINNKRFGKITFKCKNQHKFLEFWWYEQFLAPCIRWGSEKRKNSELGACSIYCTAVFCPQRSTCTICFPYFFSIEYQDQDVFRQRKTPSCFITLANLFRYYSSPLSLLPIE